MSKFKKFQKGDIVELIDNTSDHVKGYRMMVTKLDEDHFSGVCVSIKPDAISGMFIGRVCDNNLRYDCWKLVEERFILDVQPRKLAVGDQIAHVDGDIGIITELNYDHTPQNVAVLIGPHTGNILCIVTPSEWKPISAMAIEPRKTEVRRGDTMEGGDFILMVISQSENYFDGVVIKTDHGNLGALVYNQAKILYTHVPQEG